MMTIIDAPTRLGCRMLGERLKSDREAKGWSQDDLIRMIWAQVRVRDEASGELKPYSVTKTTISDLERGKILSPHPTLLAAIAAIGYAKHPSGRALTAQEMRAITYERLDPTTGERVDSFTALSSVQ